MVVRESTSFFSLEQKLQFGTGTETGTGTGTGTETEIECGFIDQIEYQMYMQIRTQVVIETENEIELMSTEIQEILNQVQT